MKHPLTVSVLSALCDNSEHLITLYNDCSAVSQQT